MRPQSTKHFNEFEYVLAVAAIFDGRISIEWLLEITDIRLDKILLSVEQGVDMGILVKDGPTRFVFKDKAERNKYRSMLDNEEKKQIDQHIVEIFLKEPIEEVGEMDAVINYKLQTQNNIDDCLRLMALGNHFRRNHHFTKAILCYRKVIKDLSNSMSEKADMIFIDAAMGYSRVSDTETDLKFVTSALKNAITRAQKHDNQIILTMLEMHLAMTDWFLDNFKSAVYHFNRGRAYAKDLNDPILKQSANALTAIFLFNQGRYKEVVENYEETASEIIKYPKTRASINSALCVGSAYGYTGDFSQGMGMLDALYKNNKDKGNLHVESILALAVGSLLLEINDVDKALAYLIEGREKSIAAPHYIVSALCDVAIANTYTRKGDMAKAKKSLIACLQICEKMNIKTFRYIDILPIIWALKQEKLPLPAGIIFNKELRSALTGQNIRLNGVAYRYLAIIHRQNGKPHKKIMSCLKLSIKLLTESGHRTQLVRTYVELAKEFLLLGDENKARETISKIAPDIELYGDYLIPDELRFLYKGQSNEKNFLNVMIKLGQNLVMIRDLRELAIRSISTVNRSIGAERGAIFLLENQESFPEPVLSTAINLTEEDIAAPEFEESMEIIKKTLNTGRGLVFNKDQIDDIDTTDQHSIKSCICVPMKLRGEPLGVLYHDKRFFRSPFKETDLELLTYFATQATIALDNAMAYEEISSLNEKLKLENQYYEEQQIEGHNFEEIIGESEAIKGVISKIIQVADTDSNVLILGETGVGKEMVARAIHRKSSRKDKPFIRVNCSAFPETLIASELFGHEKGAFTGATQLRIGRFELADKGTLFLDEIAEISMEAQVRLLRVLQSKEFERLGGKKTIHSDFRLITATNRDLIHDVEDKKFREDLYYRLNVFPIHIPPLRDRKEDIPLLSYHFLKIYEKKLKKTAMKISELDMEKLVNYPWPGNVRELENVIERGVILSVESRFKVPELQKINVDDKSKEQFISLEENERRHIIHALKKSSGVIHGKNGAAELLKVHPNTLYSKMKKVGIKKTLNYN